MQQFVSFIFFCIKNSKIGRGAKKKRKPNVRFYKGPIFSSPPVPSPWFGYFLTVLTQITFSWPQTLLRDLPQLHFMVSTPIPVMYVSLTRNWLEETMPQPPAPKTFHHYSPPQKICHHSPPLTTTQYHQNINTISDL